jgi:DNA-directed RNA polymerase omega subunit
VSDLRRDGLGARVRLSVNEFRSRLDTPSDSILKQIGKHLMTEPKKTTSNGLNLFATEEQWPGIDSRYRLIVVAALRSKQLLSGSLPRIEADSRKRRNTSIALEEVKQGLVPFTITQLEQKANGAGNESHSYSDDND